jgi:hypothetical protein
VSKLENLALYIGNFTLRFYVETVTVRPVPLPGCENEELIAGDN